MVAAVAVVVVVVVMVAMVVVVVMLVLVSPGTWSIEKKMELVCPPQDRYVVPAGAMGVT